MISSRERAAWVLMALASFWPAVAWTQEGDDVEQPVVRRLSFEGNQAIDDRTLRLSIATTQATLLYRSPFTHWLGLGDAPRFNYNEFRRDVLRIKAMYGVRGYPDAQVDTTVAQDDQDHSITITVTEGAPITVDTVEVLGAGTILDRDELERALPLRKGEPFDRILFSNSVDILQLMLRNAGHAFARVTGGFRASADGRSVAVQLEADAGPRATVERIIVEGAERIPEGVILKALAVRPGDEFSARALEQGQLDLYRLDLFRQASVRLVDSMPERPGDSTVTVRVIARVDEDALVRARMSGGYGTLSCFRGLGALELFNFTGGGRRLELQGQTSLLGVGSPLNAGFENGVCPLLAGEDTSRLKLNYSASITLHEPLLLSRRSSGTVSVFAERHTEVGAFMRETIGTELAVTRNLAEDMPLRISYALSNGRTVAEAATFCSFLNVCRIEDTGIFTSRRTRSVFAAQLVRDRTNSAMDPSTGTAASLEVRYAPSFLLTDSLMRFIKVSAEFESHHPVGLRNVFSWRVEAGTLFAPRVTIAGRRVNYAPPEERFYTGGANSVRGFGQSLLGPMVRIIYPVAVEDGVEETEIRESPTGGNLLLLAGSEFRFPLPIPLFAGKLFGAAFVDMGHVGNRGDFRVSDVKVTPGVGVRFASLLGPIRLDAAYNPHPPRASALFRVAPDGGMELVDANYRPEDTFLGRVQIHFSIGQAF